MRPEDDSIRFSLAAIKNVGVGAVEKILEARADGPFSSVEDFAKRVSLAAVNRKAWESLIKAGAFDSLVPRSQLLFNLDNIVAFAARTQKSQLDGQGDLFGASTQAGITPTLEIAPAPDELTEREQLAWERELLGIYLSRHPLEQYRDYLIKEAMAIDKLSDQFENQSVTVGGLITTVRKITTRNGANMAFVTIEDLSASIELIIFPRIYAELADLWQADRVVKVSGKLSSKDREGRSGGELKLLVDSAEFISNDNAQSNSAEAPNTPDQPSSRATIRLADTQDADKLAQMKQLLTNHPGGSEVVVMIGDANTHIKLPFKVQPSQELSEQIEELFSSSVVAIQ